MDLTSDQYRRLEAAELMRVLSAKACAHRLGGVSPAEYYRERWGRSPLASLATKTLEQLTTKAAVPPATTTGADWAQPLVGTQTMVAGFLALVRQASVLSQLPVTSTPFHTAVPFQVSGASMQWVGEMSPKPVTKLGLGSSSLARLKAAGIVVVSRELMVFSMPGSEAALQTILTNELTKFIDGTLLGANAATATSPAGILSGVTVSASIAATISAFFTARPAAIAPHWIAAPGTVGALSALDQRVPASFKGFPLVQSPAAGANLILVDAPALAVADDGLELDTSDQAVVQMDDAPAAATAATVYASLWQHNLVGIKVERFVNWKAAAGSVQFTATLS